MNWQNAKNLTLIFLVVLNIFLGVMIYANRVEYRLTSGAENAVVKLLSENNITLLAAVPKDYKPLGQLIMTPGSYDTDTVKQIFFNDTQDIKTTLEYDKTIYKNDNETLVLQNDNLVYTMSNPADIYILNEKTAVELCELFFTENKSYLSDFSLERCIPVDSGYSVEYRQRFKSNLVYSNYFIFDVTENGIVKIKYKYDKPGSFEKNTKEIISPDRALFILMKHINDEYENKEVFISSIDIVYIQTETSVNADAALKASPYYRIYYSESDRPFLINAYTGMLFDYLT